MVIDVDSGPGLHLLRGASLPALVDAIAPQLLSGLEDPFATAVVAVPGAGVQRWVAQRLSRGLGSDGHGGICAGIEFPTVPGLLARLTEEVTGLPRGEDPWRPANLQWTVLALLDELAGVGWATPLLHHGGSAVPGARMSTAQRVARLFRNYADERPDMVLAWSQGKEVGPGGEPLDPVDVWQPRLWRLASERLTGPDPVARRRSACDALKAAPVGSLPDRVFWLCPPRLSPGQRELAAAVATTRSLVVGLVDHSPVAGARRPDARSQAPRAAHPLAARLGRDALESRDHWVALSTTDHWLPAPGPLPRTLLGLLQQGVLTDDVPEAAERPTLTADTSVAFHTSHGPDRQVEVLRDVLLGLFADDATLEPRDVVVVSPQLAELAPLVRAAFTTDEDVATNPAGALRLRVADRSLRSFNPVLGVLGALLDLATGRLTSTAVLDFARLRPVSQKFGFSEDDHESLRRLVEAAGVKWGLDAQHRREFDLPIPQNTWEFGLDRMLAGVAMTDEALAPLGMVLPLDAVSSGDAELVGRLAELVARIGTLVRASRRARPAAEWLDLVRQTLAGLVEARGEDAWQLTHAWSGLADVEETLGERTTPLGLGDLRVVLADLMQGLTPRAGFGTGSLVVTSPDQLRHVPHRVVVLLGFDDAVFPRGSARDGDDLIARNPRVGDVDARAKDRQGLLDAIMAATEKLVVIRAGADPVTNEAIPAAVPLAELHHALVVTADLPGGIGGLTTTHPLQPFSPEAFRAPHRSFDAPAASGANALLGPPLPATVRWPLRPLAPRPGSDTIELGELTRVLDHPIRALLRTRGNLFVSEPDDDASLDEIPVDLDALGQWALGDRMLRLSLAGHDPKLVERAEWFRGELPPRARGGLVLDRVAQSVADIAASMPTDAPVAFHDVVVEVGSRQLRGTIKTLGDDIVEVSYSRPSGRHLLRGWVQLLALQVADPGRPWGWVMVGKGSPARLSAPPPADAAARLADLVVLADLALVEPLPLLPKLSYDYLRVRTQEPDLTPRAVWKRLDRWGAGRDAYDQLTDAAFRAFYPTDVSLTSEPPRETDLPGKLDESRFGTLARRVFAPLMKAEVS